MKILRPYSQVNLDAWPRRQHFEMLARRDYPFVGITTDLDITPLLPACRELGAKFSTAFLYILMNAVNAVENFRYRIFEGEVVLCDLVDPYFNAFSPDDELYYFAEAEYNPNFVIFDNSVEQAKTLALQLKEVTEEGNRVDVVYVSSIPWFRFTDIMQPMGLAANNTIPRFIWGKYEEVEEGRVTIPFSVTGHQGLFDGIHVAKLLTRMRELAAKPIFLERMSTRIRPAKPHDGK